MADVLVTGLQGSAHLLWPWGKLAELEMSGRTITEPACFISGKSDGGNCQTRGDT
jgi:hypothetical protein